jgi:hypothetical protein
MNYKYIGPKPASTRLLNLSGTYSFNISYDTQIIISNEGRVLNPSPAIEAIIKNNPLFLNLDTPPVVEVIEMPSPQEEVVEQVVSEESPVRRKGGRPPKAKNQD